MYGMVDVWCPDSCWDAKFQSSFNLFLYRSMAIDHVLVATSVQFRHGDSRCILFWLVVGCGRIVHNPAAPPANQQCFDRQGSGTTSPHLSIDVGVLDRADRCSENRLIAYVVHIVLVLKRNQQ